MEREKLVKKSNKTGPNDPCTCGSGKKYKKCCGDVANDNQWVLRKATPEEHQKMLKLRKDMELRDEERRSRFGQINPVVHCDWAAQNKNVVAIGNTLCIGDYRNFPEFLWLYLREVLGKEWILEQVELPPNERNPVIEWVVHALNTGVLQRHPANGKRFRPTGPSMCLLTLSYDLYILQHHGHVQEELIRRMKHDDFQAARYELFVAASMVRAGFDIEFEDECDNTKKHPEFVAIDRSTGARLAVEAKSKRRHGVLGYRKDEKAENEFKLRVGGLLRKALKKKPEYPYVIFVDMNMPPQEGQIVERSWVSDLGATAAEADAKGGDFDEYAAVVFTNTPQHYGASLVNAPNTECIPLTARRPRNSLPSVELLSRIYEGIKTYGEIPYDFEEGA